MKTLFRSGRFLGRTCLLLAFCSIAPAQGPDVIVGDLNGIENYTPSGGIDAFAVGTTSCNVGSIPLLWVANTNQHPVIAQNMYRIKDGVFEQVGQSWLKHGYTALQQSLCQPCNAHPNGSALGVGCSDPYGASLNGSRNRLGPRFEVNASTGYFTYPPADPPYPTTVDRRLQVALTDLDPALNSGARYFVEGHYIAPDDAMAGNGNNNASWQEAIIGGTASNASASLIGSTVRTQPAIYAWPMVDPAVTITPVDYIGDGRFLVGHHAIPQGGGLTKHVYAVHNLNSDRSGGCFTVGVVGATTIQQDTFHDVPYHSGEPYSGDDWSATIGSNGIEWRVPQDFATNPNANALRWGTCYTFSFVTDGTPVSEVIGLFKPQNAAPPSNLVTYPLTTNAPYDFVTIAGAAGPTGDDSSVVANLGFSFPFFDLTLNQVRISSNGYVCLTTSDGTQYTNNPLPSFPGMIAGFWDDLNPSNGGSISYATAGNAPNRRFVVDYSNVPHYPNTGSYSFQIILEENGDVTSTTVSVSDDSSCTRGISSPDGLSGTGAAHNTSGSAPAGTTWRYTYTPSMPPPLPSEAELILIGDGSAGTTLGLHLRTLPNTGVIVLGDASPGPTSLGVLGTIDLGFSPLLFSLADFTGVFGSTQNDATNACGAWQFSVILPVSLPPGVDLYFQAVVPDANAPNGQFHISNPIHLTT